MSPRARAAHGVIAAVGVFLVDVWPLLLIWRAGASGSVGDLSEVRFLGVGLAYSVALAVSCGWLMTVALRRAESSPQLGRLDPWAAYAVGVGVYNLALTAVPAIMYGLLLSDENRSLHERSWLVYLLWIVGHVGAAVVALLAARGFLGRRLEPAPQDDRTGRAVMGQT
ncbi:MAG TPA: hypothetical protein VMW33_04620 [Ilumatobacteraceae bacterium]|jgi:hypothetical protein|nr:hypothetical protein [Ilumatobacteraceae bacterium]